MRMATRSSLGESAAESARDTGTVTEISVTSEGRSARAGVMGEWSTAAVTVAADGSTALGALAGRGDEGMAVGAGGIVWVETAAAVLFSWVAISAGAVDCGGF